MKNTPDSVWDRFCGIIEKDGLIAPGDCVYAGVSGGADSVFLLLLLCRYQEQVPFRLGVIHVEHGLRGEESLADAAFVENLCRSLKVPFVMRRADVMSAARENHYSLEEAARWMRYRIFEELVRENAGVRTRIALAHNMEDQAETVLFHLARGSGLAGLAGMQSIRGCFIRPLLGISRTRIEAYLRGEGYSWRTDSTNEDVAYSRNLIRHRILPLMTEQINAQTVRHICEAAERVEEAQLFIRKLAESFCTEHVAWQDGKAQLDVYAFRKEDRLIRETVLRLLLSKVKDGAGLKDVGAVHIDDLIGLSEKGSGKRLDLPGGLKAVRKERKLLLYYSEEKFVRKRRIISGQLAVLLLAGLLAAGLKNPVQTIAGEAAVEEPGTEYQTEAETDLTEEEPVISLEDVQFDPIIFFGDSRVVGMSMVGGSGYVAKVGAGYSWMSSDGASLLLSAMNGAPEADIVFCFGINDLGNVDSYIRFFRDFSAAYPDRDMYFMSVNPIDEGAAAANGYSVTNAQIRAFNERLMQEIPDRYLDISVFLELYAITWDGIHYDTGTSAIVQELAKIMVAAAKVEPETYTDE